MTLRTDIQTAMVRIQETGNREVFAEFCFPGDLELFKGHFPGNPILPGIFQIEMTRYAMETVSGVPFEIRRIKKTKFTHAVYPEQTIRCEIKWRQDNSHTIVSAILKTADTIAGKLNLTLAPCFKET